MEKKLGVRIEDRLLEARNEGLQNMKETTLRPHGKLWGMDVFSWYKPSIHILSNTIHAFPFPVLWIGNGSDIYSTIEEDPSVCIQKKNAVLLFSASDENWKKNKLVFEEFLSIHQTL